MCRTTEGRQFVSFHGYHLKNTLTVEKQQVSSDAHSDLMFLHNPKVQAWCSENVTGDCSRGVDEAVGSSCVERCSENAFSYRKWREKWTNEPLIVQPESLWIQELSGSITEFCAMDFLQDFFLCHCLFLFPRFSPVDKANTGGAII